MQLLGTQDGVTLWQGILNNQASGASFPARIVSFRSQVIVGCSGSWANLLGQVLGNQGIVGSVTEGLSC